MTLDEGQYYITFCCDRLWESKFMAQEKPGKLREIFSPSFWPPCNYVNSPDDTAALSLHIVAHCVYIMCLC